MRRQVTIFDLRLSRISRRMSTGAVIITISMTNITLIGFNSMKEMMVSKHLASRAPEHQSDSDGDSLYEVLQDHNRIYIELILTMCSGML